MPYFARRRSSLVQTAMVAPANGTTVSRQNSIVAMLEDRATTTTTTNGNNLHDSTASHTLSFAGASSFGSTSSSTSLGKSSRRRHVNRRFQISKQPLLNLLLPLIVFGSYILWVVFHVSNMATTTNSTMTTTNKDRMTTNAAIPVATNNYKPVSHSKSLRSPLVQKVTEAEKLPITDSKADNKNPETTTSHSAFPRKYILFSGLGAAQGVGNIMNGLLAAHLFGIEFNRTVCLTKQMDFFWKVFEPADPLTIQYCHELYEQNKLAKERRQQNHNDTTINDIMSLPHTTTENSLGIINFSPPPNECALQERLASDDLPVIYMEGNTYPRWPVVPDNFFFTYYKPRPQLLQVLPYRYPEDAPSIVVHLRMQDGQGDKREGLDEASLEALGQLLPRDTTYLVTNHVPWFDSFETKFGWKHPNWKKVSHSVATIHSQHWGSREVVNQDHRVAAKSGNMTTTTVVKDPFEDIPEADVSNLQLFSDWFTLVQAKKVYHTHSDFSLSAIHWMNIDSKALGGIKDGKLVLKDASWRVDGETERVVDRIKDAPESETIRLRLCDKPKSTLNGGFRLRQSYPSLLPY